jgi:hypothetical protein
LALRHDASSSVNRDASHVAISQFDLPRVKTRSKRQTDLLGGSFERQGTADRATWTIKGRQNAITGSLDQIASVLLDHLPGDLIVTVKHMAPRKIARGDGAACRVDNVSEQDGSQNTFNIG